MDDPFAMGGSGITHNQLVSTKHLYSNKGFFLMDNIDNTDKYWIVRPNWGLIAFDSINLGGMVLIDFHNTSQFTRCVRGPLYKCSSCLITYNGVVVANPYGWDFSDI
jgi:hypothetical protein